MQLRQPSFCTSSGFTALHCAAEKGSLETLNLLLDRNMDSEPPDAVGSLLDTAVMSRNQNVVERLVDADVNSQSISKWTPLLRACQIQDLALVEYLLEHGVKRDLADGQGHMSLDLAGEVGDLSVVRKLIYDCSVDINS